MVEVGLSEEVGDGRAALVVSRASPDRFAGSMQAFGVRGSIRSAHPVDPVRLTRTAVRVAGPSSRRHRWARAKDSA